VRVRHVIFSHHLDVLGIRNRNQNIPAGDPEGFGQDFFDIRNVLDHFENHHRIERPVRKRQHRIDIHNRQAGPRGGPQVIEIDVAPDAFQSFLRQRAAVCAETAAEVQNRSARVFPRKSHKRAVMFTGPSRDSGLIEIVSGTHLPEGEYKLTRMKWPWIVALQLALVLPFLGQRIHVDDAIYFDIGRNVLLKPWHAHDFPYYLEGRWGPDMGSHSHPPFVGYWIGLLFAIFGQGPNVELKLHAGFLIFPLLFAAGMYRLARRFTELPALATAVAITSPAAIVASHTLMSDYPCLAFSTLGLALYIDGVDAQRTRDIWLGGVALALASFCSYPAVLMSLLCWLYAWTKHCTSRVALVSPLIAPVWMISWVTYSSLYFGHFILRATVVDVVRTGGLKAGGFFEKVLALPIYLGGVLILPIPLIRATLVWRRGAAAIVWALISAGLVQSVAGGYALRDRILLTVFLTLGGWILIGVLLRFRGVDAAFLSVWVFMTVAVIIGIYSSGSSRYLLPLVPPVVLLAFLRSAGDGLRFLRRAAVASLAVGIVLGLSLSAADFQMARLNRRIAQYLGKVFSGREQQVRFGGDWGLRHYTVELGFPTFLSTGDDFEGGQFIVLPKESVPYALPQDIASITIPVRRQAWQSRIPIRLINRDAHAAFYSTGWGLMPFSFARNPVEEITISQVSYLAERLPEIALENAPDSRVIVPSPAPGGGVDISIPGPSRVRIPYDGGPRTRVQFSCVVGQRMADCPIRISFQSEIPLQRAWDSVHFELPEHARGEIILDVSHDVTIRNWLMLPSGDAPWS
jgi:hypothetical protein